MRTLVDRWRRGGGSLADEPVVPTSATVPDVLRGRVAVLCAGAFAVGCALFAALARIEGIVVGAVSIVGLGCLLVAVLWVTDRLDAPQRAVIGLALLVGAGVATNLDQHRWTWPYQVPLLAMIAVLPFIVRGTGRVHRRADR